MSLKIGIVARCLNTEHIRGIGRYVFELVSHSKKHPDMHWRLFGDDPRYGMVTPEGASFDTEIFSFRGDRFQAWEQLGLPLRVRQRDVDLVHCTEGALSLWQPKPTVVSVHDTLAWEERADTLGAYTYWEKLMPAALKKSAAVVTISECSRTDILKRWPWLDPKLSVIPLGIDMAFFNDEQDSVPPGLEQQIGGARYAVYLGGPLKRKRADWAMEVLAASSQKDLKLVMCGFGSAARRSAEADMPPHLRGRVIFSEFLSDAQLRALYRGAQAVLYPTLYEGFGFPAVEAQAAGVPVIFSPVGSLTELIGPLAIVMPPHDREAWVAALDGTANMGEQFAERKRAAAQFARKFAWSECFDRHNEIYRKVGAAQS
ncbi:glycosyltransferase family 4 protein [Massilia cavernae]|nr:glycosyltransferase family 1 protein [Massilia cavernae]